MPADKSIAFRLAITSCTFSILVVALGYAVNVGYFRSFDLAISHALNMQRGVTPEWLILFMQGVSWIGGGVQRYVIVTILTLALWRWWGWGAALAMGLTTLVSAFTSDVMKAFFGRVRPDLVPQLDIIHSPAFPSGHSNNAAVVYILFIMLVAQARHPLWQVAAAIMIVLTGVSRIMLGVHWPTDVLGGWMLGASFAMAAAAVIAYRQHQRTAHFPSVLSP
ncbi:phosphatase PAP2 family protein [Sphingorhabdus lacus]|uniref:Phosphatase PAP2 family protein n=1 Tax=Sphingorhabdus lacus TaxID=392610 RepID=A0A6I6LBE3_9SPHN|nr:phosphatase PAP2 family protein [Sphingorhabdus lacus]QGY79822.1 phosphatase PAP2 family protein [Sphingorhabdus lacus]